MSNFGASAVAAALAELAAHHRSEFTRLVEARVAQPTARAGSSSKPEIVPGNRMVTNRGQRVTVVRRPDSKDRVVVRYQDGTLHSVMAHLLEDAPARRRREPVAA